ncbi:MAG: hypothetical protein FJ026_14065, partial [Chloroflexi bacterium]|nr:hypothetical protein [Chloroflexota bacterium]
MDRQETCKTLKSVISDKATRANRYWGVAIPVLGMILGGYLWEFLNTNLDFTGPQNLNPASGLLLTLLVGPSLLLCLWGLSGAILARRFGLSWAEGLKRDAPSYLPVGLLALSPIAYLVSGHHTPAYQAAVIVLVSLVVSAVVTLKAWTVHDIQGGAVGLPERWCQRFVWAAIALFVVVCGTLFVLRYNAYNVWGGD